jgi:hypothetical protein
MSASVSLKIKRLVAERARNKCEYCRVHQEDSNFYFHIEHIISKKHGGTDDLGNLAFSCSRCNWKKGSDIGTFIEENGPLVYLFNPRTDNWFDHFEIIEGAIAAKTSVGAATIKLLELNTPDLIVERRELVAGRNYP